MPDPRIRQDALMLPLGGDARFCVRRVPASGPVRGTVVHAPAFAEEMNKARHVVAAGARALATDGYAVLHVDPFGCGDSPGDFGDASYARWVEDLVAAAQWAHAAHGGALWLWGLRAGALVAAEALRALPRGTALLLWQPVVSGAQHLTQFLRLALAGGMLASDAERAGTRALKQTLQQGDSVEVAGYRIAPALAAGLGAAELVLPDDFAGRVAWLEVSGAPPELSPAAQARVAAMRRAGAEVTAAAVTGPGFWQSTELEDCPALIAATRAALGARDDATAHRAPALL